VTHLFALLPVDYQEVGNDIILEAARQCGASEDNLKIEWKGGRVVITVHGDVYVSDVESSGEDEEDIYGDDDIELEYTDEDESDDVDDDGEEADLTMMKIMMELFKATTLLQTETPQLTIAPFQKLALNSKAKEFNQEALTFRHWLEPLILHLMTAA